MNWFEEGSILDFSARFGILDEMKLGSFCETRTSSKSMSRFMSKDFSLGLGPKGATYSDFLIWLRTILSLAYSAFSDCSCSAIIY